MRFIQVWIYTEVGQLDRAEAFVSDLLDLSERHGFDAWRGLGTMQQGFIDALRLIGPPTASSELPARLSALAESVDMFRSLELKIYLTAFDGILGRRPLPPGISRRPAAVSTSACGSPKRPRCTSMTPNCCGCERALFSTLMLAQPVWATR